VRRFDDCDEMLPPPRRTTLQKVGRYTVSKGGNADKFWPLDPNQVNDVRSVFEATADVMPTIWGSDLNTLVLPPRYGIFDIIIHFSDDFEDLDQKEIQADSLQADYSFPWLMGRPTKTEAVLAADEFQNAHIAFAVYIEQGKDEFVGKLQLEANLKAGPVKKIELQIKVKVFKKADDLFVFFVCHKAAKEPISEAPKVTHTWVKMQAVGKDGKPIEDAMTEVQILRDNLPHGYQDRQRRVYLYSQDDGFYAAFSTRKTVGLPMQWPIIFRATKDGYVMRGHMLRLEGADTKNNLEPLAAPATRTHIPMLADAEADLSNFSFLLDPGHGVVYSDTGNRRSQEWLSADMLADKISDLLTGRFNVPAGNIYWTRTAGFGLIAPEDIAEPTAPERGARRYVFDLGDPAQRKIRVDSNTPVALDSRLKTMSDLLLTTHDDDNNPQPVPDDRRSDLLQLNAATVQAAVTRRLNALNLHWRIADGTFQWDGNPGYAFNVQRRRPNGKWEDAGSASAGWDTDQEQYLISADIDAPTAAETAALAQTLAIQINQADWFTLDDDMMRTLEDRSARWSIQSEIGFDPQAAAAVTQDWLDRTRDAMDGAGAFDHMKQKIRWSNDHLPPKPGLTHKTMGWDAGVRRDYFNHYDNQNPPPWDFIVTIHENGNFNGSQMIGFDALVAQNNPLPEQLRIAKTFVKYVDPFDQGTAGGGISPSAVAGLVNSGGHRTKYVFLELEFMDTHIKGTPDFQYQDMLSDRYLNDVSQAIVAAMVEWLVLRQDQGTFDAVKYHGQWNLW